MKIRQSALAIFTALSIATVSVTPSVLGANVAEAQAYTKITVGMSVSLSELGINQPDAKFVDAPSWITISADGKTLTVNSIPAPGDYTLSVSVAGKTESSTLTVTDAMVDPAPEAPNPEAPAPENPAPNNPSDKPKDSGSSDIDPKVAGGLAAGAAALGLIALSSGGSSEGSSQKQEEKKPEAPKAPEAGAAQKGTDAQAPQKGVNPDAPQKGVDPNAPQKGIDPAKAPKADKAPSKADKANRGMLASTGVSYPATLGAIAVLLTIAAGAITILRRRGA